MGIVEDKVIKNHFASELIYNKYKHEKTCDLIEEDKSFGIQKIAEPMGVLAGIIPVTNPTSTTIFKALIALKTRNAIIFSPHPRAKRSTVTSAKTVLEAAIAAGAPEHIIGWIDEPTVERGAYFLSPEEKEKVTKVLLKDGHLNAAIVGQSVGAIAQLAGIRLLRLEYQGQHRAENESLNLSPCTLPKVLIAEVDEIGVDEPFSYEKLSPVLAMYRASNFLDQSRKRNNW